MQCLTCTDAECRRCLRIYCPGFGSRSVGSCLILSCLGVDKLLASLSAPCSLSPSVSQLCYRPGTCYNRLLSTYSVLSESSLSRVFSLDGSQISIVPSKTTEGCIVVYLYHSFCNYNTSKIHVGAYNLSDP